MKPVSEETIQSFVGQTEEEARVKAIRLMLDVRILHRDGVDSVGTCEFRNDRINLSIVNDIVTEAHLG